MSTRYFLSARRLRAIIREEVQMIVEKEVLKLRISLLPQVSEREQQEIEKMFGKRPGRRELLGSEPNRLRKFLAFESNGHQKSGRSI